MFILLDTNVVSEMMRTAPHPSVEAWFAGCNRKSLFFSTIGEAELRAGAAALPAGRRRESLVLQIDSIIDGFFGTRMLPFDSRAARCYAEIVAMRKAAGRSSPPIDGQIAAIALSQNMAVATRNVQDFEMTGAEIVNPWEVA